MSASAPTNIFGTISKHINHRRFHGMPFFFKGQKGIIREKLDEKLKSSITNVEARKDKIDKFIEGPNGLANLNDTDDAIRKRDFISELFEKQSHQLTPDKLLEHGTYDNLKYSYDVIKPDGKKETKKANLKEKYDNMAKKKDALDQQVNSNPIIMYGAIALCGIGLTCVSATIGALMRASLRPVSALIAIGAGAVGYDLWQDATASKDKEVELRKAYNAAAKEYQTAVKKIEPIPIPPS